MDKRQHIVVCDQDCIVGDMLIYVLQKADYRVTRLKGGASQLMEQLLRCEADLLIANSGSDLETQLHILRCCRTKYPKQKQILIVAALANLELRLKEEKIEGVLLKPFKLNRLNQMIENLLPQDNLAASSTGKKLLVKLKKIFFKIFNLQKYSHLLVKAQKRLSQLWRCQLLKGVEHERLQVLHSAYKFCQSKFASQKHILDLWLYLEFLERRYLLAKCGANVEREALQFYYTSLKGQLERSLNGRAVSLKGGDGLGPELDSAQFSKFCSRLKNKELSFGCFRQAAQARLVRWALSSPSVSSIHKILKRAPLPLRKTSASQHLSDKVRAAEAKAEIEILALASANQDELGEVFRQAWC